MKIGIVLYPYNEDRPGGLARTIFEWTTALLRNDRNNEYVIFLKEKPKKMPVFEGSNWKVEILGGGILWKEMLRFHSSLDLYVFQTPVLPFFTRLKKTLVIVQDFPYKYLKPETVRMGVLLWFVEKYHRFSLGRADHLVAVSEATKQDTVRFFGVPPEKITQVYMGYKRVCETPQTVIELPSKFFLYIGVVKERKNVMNIIKGLQFFLSKNPKVPHLLVIAGKAEGPYFEEVSSYIQKEHLEDRVLFIGYLNDGQLSTAYRKAEALVFPSIIEGFGFPVLEAMDCGLPVITSNIFGPSEVGKNQSAFLVNPHNYKEIGAAMSKVLDPLLRQAVIESGIKRSKEFSWDKAASELLAVAESVART